MKTPVRTGLRTPRMVLRTPKGADDPEETEDAKGEWCR